MLYNLFPVTFDSFGGCLLLADSLEKPGGEEPLVMHSPAVGSHQHRAGKDGEWIGGVSAMERHFHNMGQLQDSSHFHGHGKRARTMFPKGFPYISI